MLLCAPHCSTAPGYSSPFSKQILDHAFSTSPPIRRLKMLFSVLQQMHQLFLPSDSLLQPPFQVHVGQNPEQTMRLVALCWCQKESPAPPRCAPPPRSPGRLPSLPLDGAIRVASSPAGAHSFQTIESFPLGDFLIKTFLFALLWSSTPSCCFLPCPH